MDQMRIYGLSRWAKGMLLWMALAEGFLSTMAIAQSRTLYVSPSGNDVNNGLSIASPFLTIARGISSASAGDTIYLLPGTYREVVSVIEEKGIAERPLCILGYEQSPGKRPIIDGEATSPSNTNTTNSWMLVQNSTWVEIGNIEFRNGWTNPIRVFNSSYLTFNGCTFYGAKVVITASGSGTHHVLVQNCYWDQGGEYLWRLVSDPAGTDAWTSMHEGPLQYYNGTLIDLNGTGGSVVIRNNTIVNAFNGLRWRAGYNFDSNIEIYDNSVSNIRDNDFEPETFAYNLHIYHNRSHNIHKTMSVDHVQGGFIYYYGNRITSENDIWSNQVCTSFWKVYGAGTNNLIYPMYIFNNSFCGVGKVFPTDDSTIAVQLKHLNNAYYITGSRNWVLDAVDSTDEFDFDISNKSWPLNIVNRSQEQHGAVTDVQFVDTRSFDLRLKPTSPAIDRGTPMSFPELGWTQSFQGSAPDVGAYEGEDLQEGPPFRFRLGPGMAVVYAEKPRIVRSRLSENALSLSFSEALDPATISTPAIMITEKGVPVGVLGQSLSDDNYRMNIDIEPGRAIDPRDLAVTFNPLPKGINGETATLWAAALASYKRALVTSVSGPQPAQTTERKLSIEMYPNPINAQGHVSIVVPPSFAGSQVAVVRIYDILGRRVKEQTFSPLIQGLELSMNVEQLITGTYFVVLQIAGQTISKKFIILK